MQFNNSGFGLTPGIFVILQKSVRYNLSICVLACVKIALAVTLKDQRAFKDVIEISNIRLYDAKNRDRNNTIGCTCTVPSVT